MNAPAPIWKHLAQAAVARIWLVFSVALAFGLALSSAWFLENPFTSDDPHILGTIFAIVAAAVALVYSIFDSFSRGKLKHWMIALVLTLWCGWLAAMDYFVEHGEGDGWGYFFAIISGIGGALGWVLCLWPPGSRIRTGIAAIGVVCLLLRGYVELHMNARSRAHDAQFGQVQ